VCWGTAVHRGYNVRSRCAPLLYVARQNSHGLVWRVKMRWSSRAPIIITLCVPGKTTVITMHASRVHSVRFQPLDYIFCWPTIIAHSLSTALSCVSVGVVGFFLNIYLFFFFYGFWTSVGFSLLAAVVHPCGTSGVTLRAFKTCLHVFALSTPNSARTKGPDACAVLPRRSREIK
jgi:hypothetical protein